jgi:N-acetylmuramoyl-L-alanine amidase
MNRKQLTTVMSVILLTAVYIVSYVLLPAGKTVNGNTHAQETINIDFTDKTVVLDSGHGGADPGKESADGILEKNINLAIAGKLQSLLEDAGIRVVMTRTDDNGLYQESDINKKVADLEKRCAIINDSGADIVVSIHQNSYQSAAVKGAQMFYYKHSAQGKKLAETMQSTCKDELDAENKRVAKADSTYYMLIHTDTPTVIAECGFLSNPEEAAMLNTQEYQQKVAQALYNGVIAYFTAV